MGQNLENPILKKRAPVSRATLTLRQRERTLSLKRPLFLERNQAQIAALLRQLHFSRSQAVSHQRVF